MTRNFSTWLSTAQRCYVSHRSHRCQGVFNFGDQTRNGGARQLNRPARCSRKFQRLPRAPCKYLSSSFVCIYDMQNVYTSRDTRWHEKFRVSKDTPTCLLAQGFSCWIRMNLRSSSLCEFFNLLIFFFLFVPFGRWQIAVSKNTTQPLPFVLPCVPKVWGHWNSLRFYDGTIKVRGT